jgi:hypothetical protein
MKKHRQGDLWVRLQPLPALQVRVSGQGGDWPTETCSSSVKVTPRHCSGCCGQPATCKIVRCIRWVVDFVRCLVMRCAVVAVVVVAARESGGRNARGTCSSGDASARLVVRIPCDSAVWAGGPTMGMQSVDHGNVLRPWAAPSVSQAPMHGWK